MKSLLLLLFVIPVFYTAIGQVHYRTLDHNNASALISDAGTFFQDHSNGVPGYEIPKNSGIKAIYSTQFWFGGITMTGDTNYILGGIPGLGQDLFNGPYSTTGDYNDPIYQNDWDSSIWMFTQEEIDNYSLWWECEQGITTVGCSTVPIPTIELMYNLYSWPGNGNITNGEDWWMAPYYDYDADGFYNPDDGDYPLIKGCKAVYLIQNDDAGIKAYSGSESLGIEIHYMFYQYSAWNSYLNNVTFVDIVAINRGANNYPNFASGLFADVDLGFYGDDYIGCDSSNNMMYFYNGDIFDEAFVGPGYGNTPAALGFVALNNNITSSTPYMGYNTPWNYLDGKQINGQDWIHPNGYPTKYVYSGNPNNITEWSEFSEMNPPGDRRGVMSTVHGTLNGGDTIRQSYAIIFSNDGDNIQNAQNIIDLADDVKLFYDNESNNACQGGVLGVDEKSMDEISVYPNPSSGIFIIKNVKGAEIKILDVTGNEIKPLLMSNGDSTQIDLTGSPVGLYILQVFTLKGIKSYKIVVD